jgi:carboxylate-amine ligase
VEYTQVWWSVRPHFSFGTVEVRICDAQSTAAGVRGPGRAHHGVRPAGRPRPGRRLPSPTRRGAWSRRTSGAPIRFGQDGRLIDFDRVEEYAAADAVDRLLAWTAPVRADAGLGEPALPALNGAQRQRRALDTGAHLREVHAAAVQETRDTYRHHQEATA